MFLTQEHSSSFISIGGDRTFALGSKDVVWPNIAMFQEIENVLEDYPEHSYQGAFSIDKLCQKLVAHVTSHISNCYSVINSLWG